VLAETQARAWTDDISGRTATESVAVLQSPSACGAGFLDICVVNVHAFGNVCAECVIVGSVVRVRVQYPGEVQRRCARMEWSNAGPVSSGSSSARGLAVQRSPEWK
jgi:hypothetical protein